MRVRPDPMAISIRRPRQAATALGLALACASAAPAKLPAMLDAGTEGGYAFTIEAKSVVRDGDRVRFRLLAANESGADHYESSIEVDCAHRTRRQLTAIADDGSGHVRTYGAERASPHPISQGTRADREMRLMCTHVGAQAAEPPHLPASASELADAGTDAGGARAIFIDTVRRHDASVDYMLQTIAPGQRYAMRQHVAGDCERKLRGVMQEADAPAGSKVWVSRVTATSREGRELEAACALPEGPPSRWFAGFVVTPDGVVIAPHERTLGCAAIVTGAGAARRTLDLIANEDDMTLLRVHGGGRWPVLPAIVKPMANGPQPVTVLGVHGTEPRVSAAFAEPTGANVNDAGWPQVRMLAVRAQPAGLVWDWTGSAVGIALALGRPVSSGDQAWVRMLPAQEVQRRLERHQLAWRPADETSLDPEQAMRRALASTLPLLCLDKAAER